MHIAHPTHTYRIWYLRCRSCKVLLELLKQGTQKNVAEEHIDNHKYMVLESCIFVYFGI